MPVDYIKYIRKKIGHDRLLSVGNSTVIFNEKNEVLLEKRADNGQYCFPGGGLDFDETVEEGMRREVKEETGLELKDVKLIGIRSGRKQQFRYPNGDITDYVDFYFLARPVDLSKLKKEDDEVVNLKFYSLDELPPESEFLRGTYFLLEKLKKNDLTFFLD